MQIVDTSNKNLITPDLGEVPAKYNDCGAKAKTELESRGWTVDDAGPEAGADAARCANWSPSPP